MSFTDYYNNLKGDPNNFSNWFPKIENCGIMMPRSVCISVPEEIVKAFFMDDENEDMMTVLEWVKKEVMPLARKVRNCSPFIFVKNGSFSDKYTFSNCRCRVNAFELTVSIININYSSLMLGAGGCTELILREYIPAGEKPCIYQGMPLRPEFRCFYDFDQKKLLYTKNYWDWDYCHDAIAEDATDKIVYEKIYPDIEAEYTARLSEVEEMVTKYMPQVQLSGIWSVDIMYNSADDIYYLIDMAIAKQSAYWDPKYEQ